MKIGIDLGTTNSALAYIDEREAEDRDFPPLHIFETPQLVAVGRTEARRTLPSFLYLEEGQPVGVDRKSTRLNSSHLGISYAVFCLKKKQTKTSAPPLNAPSISTYLAPQQGRSG